MIDKLKNIKMGLREDYDFENRRVGFNTVVYEDIKYDVSTIDLGLDHGIWGEERGVYWETMIFTDNESLDQQMIRYISREEAKVNHNRIVEALKIGDFKSVRKSLDLEE